MENDFLKEIPYVGLIARLKRLSDTMLYSVRDVYKAENVDIEPNWHLVFLILEKHKTRTMSEIADAFQLSQPAIFKILKKMKAKGYIEITVDQQDSRKRQVQLSSKALRDVPRFEKIWRAGQASIKELLDDDEAFLDLLEQFEQNLAQQSFKDRVLHHLQKPQPAEG